MSSLIGPIPRTAVHMAVDMQVVFAAPTSWHVAELSAIIPKVVAVAAAMPGRTLFTRFVTPYAAEHANGHWKTYYRRWSEFTGALMAPELIEIVPELAVYATSETLIDKLTYSAFEAPECQARLEALDADTIIFTGVETDVCVLATLMTAVDRGYRVIAVRDALCSSSAEAHHATLTQLLIRLPDQIEIVDTTTVLSGLL